VSVFVCIIAKQCIEATGRLRKLQAMVTSVLKFRLMVRLPLKTWVHPGGRVALMGDACHPMLVSENSRVYASRLLTHGDF
jgi:hypothetical protein